MAEQQPLRVAILWHMHQPNYQEPGSSNMMLPWVRLHATKDYLDMLLSAQRYESVRVTFNLVPSLLDQIQLYLDGGSDPHLDLSRTSATDLSAEQKAEILGSFFNANEEHLIRPNTRYNELYRKTVASLGQDIQAALFSSEEMRDIQVWSNLAWVDPTFRQEQPIKALFDKGRQFTEQDKQNLLDWQVSLMKRIVPAYRDFLTQDRGDISFTPYYHPILPLLCDTDDAREAIPNIELPSHRFAHPEDAVWHIKAAVDKYQQLFDRPLQGMWPSEGSVSESVARLAADHGIKWLASDEEILYYSLKKSGQDLRSNSIHAVYEYPPGLKLLFRDHALSDRIGFVYSGWEADKAAADFTAHLKRLRGLLKDQLDQAVVPVILDGENAWEYFADDGTEFLEELYRTLHEDPELTTITMTDAATNLPARPLKKIFAGSWINHNFKIWIGHSEDNAAWDRLWEARTALTDRLASSVELTPERTETAWRQIHIAEGSDWCWWYGDEHRGANNEQFDAIFRRQLTAVYDALDLDVPLNLLSPIYRSGTGMTAILPDTLLTPVVDGRLTYFYEWSGAGHFDCLQAGGAMHRVERYLSHIHFAYDHQCFYIRLDFVDPDIINSLEEAVMLISFFGDQQQKVTLPLSTRQEVIEEPGVYRACSDECLEVAVERPWLLTEGHGRLGFTVALFDGQQKLEAWPDGEPISVTVAEPNKELFWPT